MDQDKNTEVIETSRIDQKKPENIQFDDIYEDYFNKIFRYVYNRTGNNKDAEDLTSQIFLTILEGLPKYKDNGHLAAWIFTIARNKIADHYRKRKQFVELDENRFITSDEKMLRSVIHQEHMEELSKILDGLPDDEKELIRLRILGELKVRRYCQDIETQ